MDAMSLPMRMEPAVAVTARLPACARVLAAGAVDRRVDESICAATLPHCSNR